MSQSGDLPIVLSRPSSSTSQGAVPEIRMTSEGIRFVREPSEQVLKAVEEMREDYEHQLDARFAAARGYALDGLSSSNPQAYALLALDLDGTLLRSDQRVDAADVAAIAELRPSVADVLAGPPMALRLGFPRDGKIDVTTANWGADSVSVLLNWKDTVSTPTTPTGINLAAITNALNEEAVATLALADRCG